MKPKEEKPTHASNEAKNEAKRKAAAAAVIEVPAEPIAETKSEIILAVETESLILVGPGYQIVIPPEAESKRTRMLTTAAAITSIATVEELEEAQAELKALAKFRNETEKARELVKAPVLQIGRKIDDDVRSFSAPLRVQEDRIDKLVRAYALKVEEERRAEQVRLQNLERERAAAAAKAERERLIEEQRIEAARLAEEAAQRAAEEARIQAAKRAEEAAQRATAPAAAPEEEEDEGPSEEELAEAAAIDAAAKLRREAEEAAAKRAAAIEADRIAEAVREEELRRASYAATRTTKGVSFPLAFEVEDIAALYAHDPSLVTLTPKAREIAAMLKKLEDEGAGAIPTVPGLRIFRDAKVGRR